MTTTPNGGGPEAGGRGDKSSAVRRWEPFTKGHTKSLKHGVRSERTIQPLAEAMVNTALQQAEYLRDPSFEPALISWARLEAKAELLHRWLDENGMVDPETGKARDAARLLTTYENSASKLRAVLGMDPVSRAKLMRETAATQVDLAQLMAKAKEDKQ